MEKDEYQRVCKLLKGLYGLKQSGRLWYKELGMVLGSIGFKRLVSDPSIYVWDKDGSKVILPAFVDDLTIVSKSKALVQEVKDALARAFKIRDLGPISLLLGVHITRDRPNRTIHLSQRQYIVDVLENFGMQDCTGVQTPMVPNLRLTKDMCPSTPAVIAFMADKPYINLIGAQLRRHRHSSRHLLHSRAPRSLQLQSRSSSLAGSQASLPLSSADKRPQAHLRAGSHPVLSVHHVHRLGLGWRQRQRQVHWWLHGQDRDGCCVMDEQAAGQGCQVVYGS